MLHQSGPTRIINPHVIKVLMSKPRRILKRSRLSRLLVGLGLLAWGSALPLSASAQGIPEPPVVFYGEVRHLVNGSDQRVTSGTLEGTLQPSDGGLPVVVQAELSNINDQFSYVLFTPCETVVGSMSATVNSLRLLSPPSAPLAYTFHNVTVEGQPAYLKLPGQNPFWMAATNRGVLQRVDLTLDLSLVDSDGDGIPDVWEQMYGFNASSPGDALLDADQDGQNNLSEYVAGTNPTNAYSVFAFTRIQPAPPQGVWLDWFSASNRLYVLQRSGDLRSEFVDIRMDIGATPPLNSYLDATAVGSGPWYYRLRIQEVPLSNYDSDGNGLADAWERQYFGEIRTDGTLDSDGDGLSNLAEFIAGTNPTNASSALRFVSIRHSDPGRIDLQWSSVINKTYTILWSADPASGYDILMSGLPASPPVNSFQDPYLFPVGFYRILVEP